MNDSSPLRFCIMCGKTIAARAIRLVAGLDGQRRPACPTRGCEGSEPEWIPMLAPQNSESAWEEWRKILDELSDGDAPVPRKRNRSRRMLAD